VRRETLAEGVLPSRLEELGRFVAGFEWDRASPALRDQLLRTLLDTAGVMVAGARTPEMRRLFSTWSPEPGPARVFGSRMRVAVDSAAYLNGVSAVTLELDEGNKYARGHPASHAFPAALAVAQARRASGSELAAALIAGHEVASRFGRATRLRPEVHPHGNWGVAGAAAAVSRLLGLGAGEIAGALDTALGLAGSTPWHSALVGNPVRNAWVGAANLNGIVAARMAAAGLSGTFGTATATLGGILGEFDPSGLTEELGTRFDLEGSYFKRHASCSYTHPPADAALEILERNPDLDLARVESVVVETHGLAAPLDRTRFPTRLAAMFSIPYVVSVALVTGGCGPEAFDDECRSDARIRRLACRTRVEATSEFDRRLPESRGARVAVLLEGGRRLVAEVPNPVGDVAHRPFGLEEVRAKLDGLGVDARPLEALVRELLATGDAGEVLSRFP
jgi:2-methylcitrate dehydratase PrpD